MERKTAAAYIRVSTDNQTELSPDSQIKVVRQYAKQNGFIIPKEFIFRDDGLSGRKAEKRPQFNLMIATSKEKPSPFSAILLWKFSRFARNQEESIFYKSMLRKNGVEVISVSEPVLDGPFGTLIERIIEWSDEYYSIRLSGEVKRGMTERVERGGAVSVPPFGYNIENKKYIINPITAPIVQKIFSDYTNGISSIQIARELNNLGIKTTRGNTWENRTVDYILQNPVYIGKIRWNPKRKTKRNYSDPDIMIVGGQHEAIIDDDIFNQVQIIFAKNRRKYRSYVHKKINEEYMLHGLVKCSNCGASLGMAANGISLQCIKYTHGKCNVSHSITIKSINEMVINGIEEAFKGKYFNLSIKNSKGNAPDIEINALIEKEKLKLRRIKEAFENGVYTLEDYKESKQTIVAQINNLTEFSKASQVNKIQNSRNLTDKSIDLIAQLRNDNLCEKEKREILCSFVEKIVFNRKSSNIELYFYI